MCGSGTVLTEALMHYCRTPAGYLRERFGFEALPDFDAAAWASVRQASDAAMRPLPPGLIAGSDLSDEAVAAARANAAALPEGEHIELAVKDFNDIPALHGYTLVSNPPYGIRVGKKSDMGDFYGMLGDFMKQRCAGSTAFLYAGDPALLKRVGLRASWKKPLVNGALDGRLAKYELYSGSQDSGSQDSGSP
jgi:putative N6-adenine-specific DNA methylase